MTNKVLIAIVAIYLFQVSAFAQSKQKVQRAFLKELNAVLTTKATADFDEGITMMVDSAFTINQMGELTVTVRHKTDSSSYRIRRVITVNKIKDVTQDRFILLASDNAASIFSSDTNSEALLFRGQQDLLHVGVKEDNFKTLEKLKRKLKAVQRYYPIKI